MPKTAVRTPTVAGLGTKQKSISRHALDNIARWLDWQCRMLAGVQCGVIFLKTQDKPDTLKTIATWPEQSKPVPTLRKIAERAFTEHHSIFTKVLDKAVNENEVFDYIGYPLMRGEQAVGAVSIALEIRSDPQRKALQQLVEWGVIWLEEILNQPGSDSSEESPLTIDATKHLTQDMPLPVVGHELCSLLADQLPCARVALGLSHGLQTHVIALSHQVRFNRRLNRVVEIEAAMEECLDQDCILVLPAVQTQDSGLTRSHAKLLQEDTNGAVCSVPLRVDGQAIGALTLVHKAGTLFDLETVASVEAIANQLAPVLDLKRREAQPGWRKMLHTLKNHGHKLIGPGHFKVKLTVAAIALLVTLLFTVQTEHLISARSTIEGSIQQVVAAPFDGYILEASARAGDQVKKGDILAVLDNRELLLQQEKLYSERGKITKEYQEALATRNRAKVSIFSAQLDQTKAQLHLLDDQLKRTQLRAPFDSVIVTGDLSHTLGAPVERGQVLFELVPEKDYRISMAVDDHDIANLKPMQNGSLRLAGMPGQLVALKVSRIVPIANANQGANLFRVEAEITEKPEGLRPGMQGVAKVVVGQDSLIQVWTHQLVQRLRLWFWSLGF
ncbi:MAG: HlyD family efflux transporter periplasmic adaptor subunit [Gammaproteobacteria bacterium]|nr:HlyD family efflux transporter periplasmic adaptor subunit [Gammaproteobacteria bacterium]